MTVKEVLELTKGHPVIIEVHYSEIRKQFGCNILTHVTKTDAYDDLTKFDNKLVKKVCVSKRVAPIYSLLETVRGFGIDKEVLRTIQLCI